MGVSQAKCTVANLNYSGIYLSPFQYYEVENWKELESIGRIFEKQLQEYYPRIKQQTEKFLDYSMLKNQSERIKKTFQEQHKSNSKPKNQSLNSIGKIFMKEQYDRSSFTWNVGDIDKEIHSERYSPLYTSKLNIENSNFAGIIKQNNDQWLANQRQFLQKWGQTFTKLQKQSNNSQQVKIAKKSQSFQKYQCSMLDFLCYKSIILYLYANLDNKNALYINYRNLHSQCAFQSITKQSLNSELVKQYKKYMHKYFEKIDTKKKLQITLNAFFSRKGPQVIVFTQATSELRAQLQKNNDFFIYGPQEKKSVKQTILLVKRKIPFKQIDQQYLQSQNSRALYSNDLKRIKRKINQKENISLLKKQIQQFIKQYFQETSKIQLNKILNQIVDYPQPIIQKLIQCFGKYQINQTKGSLEIQLAKYRPSIVQYWNNKSKIDYEALQKQEQKESVRKFLGKLEQQGILGWAKYVQFVKFKDNRERQVIIGAFHLSSKLQTNNIQIQILGLIIYHFLEVKQYNFIFTGNFNSQLSLKQKDKSQWLFEMTKQILPQKQINSLSNKINSFPNHSNYITTKKKRTILQRQVRKANQLAQKCYDLIITSYPLINDKSHVCQIGQIGKTINNNQNFLPHKQHPYDHFLVEATLDLSQQND